MNPKWIKENYQGAEIDFTEWLREIARKEVFAELIERTNNSTSAIAQTDAMVEHWIMSRTKELTKTTERAFIYQLYQADRTGWYHYLPGELDTIEELLATMLDDLEEGTSRYYDMKFIVDTVMPLMRKAGAKPEDVWGLPNGESKARAAVPVLRDIMKRAPLGELLSDADVDEMFDIVRSISNPDQSYREFRDEMYEKRGKGRIQLPKIPASKYFMPRGEQWFLVKAPTEKHAKAIEFALNGLLSNTDIKDPWALVNEIANLLPKSAKGNGFKPGGLVEILQEIEA